MRKRDLAPGFFKNPELVELPYEYRILFAGLWCLADRDGLLEDRAKAIRMEVFPADDVDCEAGLHALAGKHQIVRYEVEGRAYIWIPGFARHQHPHPKERASTIPPYLGDTQYLKQDDLFAPSPHLGGTRVIPFPAGSSGPSGSSGSSGPSGPSGSCAELGQADSTPPVVAIPLVDGSDFVVTQAMVDDWRPAYPAIDIAQQLHAMRVWCNANKANRKTRGGVERFITRWLGKEQDQAGRAPAARQAARPSVLEQNEAVREQLRQRDRGGQP